MHIIHDEIGLPKITSSILGENAVRFTFSPLPNGYGMTLGNALRRVLLSSLPGAAITAVKIDKVTHEYTSLAGLKDSTLQLCLNLKNLSLKKHSKDFEIATLSQKEEGDVLAGNISASSDVEILTPDLVLTTLSKKGSLDMELKIEKGVGYLPALEQQKREKEEDGWIYLDATFSPVRRIKYDVSAVRVGENTNLDQLDIEVETNGSLSPQEAMRFAARVLQSYFEFFQEDQKEMVEEDFIATTTPDSSDERGESAEFRESYEPIEVLNLSPRTQNSLINGEIESVEDLVKCSQAKLENLRGFGKKAMDEIIDVLAERGLSLSED